MARARAKRAHEGEEWIRGVNNLFLLLGLGAAWYYFFVMRKTPDSSTLNSPTDAWQQVLTSLGITIPKTIDCPNGRLAIVNNQVTCVPA